MDQKPSTMRTFYTIWTGQVISLLGSGLTNFGLAVWIFEQTGQATPFALTVLFGNLPRIILAPVAGSVADRWNRRLILIISDTMAAVLTLLVFLFFLNNQLSIGMIYIFAFVSSCFMAFQEPAYAASVTMMVPKDQLTRANSLVQMQQALGMLVSPLLAGFLFGVIGLRGIILIDFATFFFAVGALLIVTIPQPKQKATAETEKPNIWADTRFGFAYLYNKRGLFYLLIFFAVVNFFFNFTAVLWGPLILFANSPRAFGIIQTVSGLAMLLGTIVMSAWGGPQRKVPAMLGFLVLASVGIIITGLNPSPWVIGAGVFIFLFVIPIGSAMSQTLFQTKVDPAVQGRVFAMRGMLSQSMMPLAFILAGPLADRLFEPLLLEGGALANSLIGQIVGIGPGRGTGFLFVIAGLLLILATAVAFANPSIRHLEERLPDVIQDEAESMALNEDETAVTAEPTLA
ncbi:MAG: MFS transporter [Chloroflexota bacterium]